MSPTEIRLLTVPEVAALLRVPRKTIYALCESRRIPFTRIGRSIRFFERDVLAWLDENRVLPLVR